MLFLERQGHTERPGGGAGEHEALGRNKSMFTAAHVLHKH